MEHSPLARLPAELRNRIYELVLVQDKPVSVFKHFAHKGSRISQAALLQTCQQVRHEAIPISYSGNAFLVKKPLNWHGTNTIECLHIWLDNLTPQIRGLLRRIFVDACVPLWGYQRDHLEEKGLNMREVELFYESIEGDWVKW